MGKVSQFGMKKLYITLKLTDSSIRVYESVNGATKDSIMINENDHDHPSFDLYVFLDKQPAEYLGKLVRRFGTNEFYWR